MSRLENTTAPPGPECSCGAELRAVPLPASLAAVAGLAFMGRVALWVHAVTGDTRCYPDSANAEDAAATAAPADDDAPLLDPDRPMTRTERIEARHLLQELSEQARTVRNAMDPLHGMHTIRLSAWRAQLESLTAQLDKFTDGLR